MLDHYHRFTQNAKNSRKQKTSKVFKSQEIKTTSTTAQKKLWLQCPPSLTRGVPFNICSGNVGRRCRGDSEDSDGETSRVARRRGEDPRRRRGDSEIFRCGLEPKRRWRNLRPTDEAMPRTFTWQNSGNFWWDFRCVGSHNLVNCWVYMGLWRFMAVKRLWTGSPATPGDLYSTITSLGLKFALTVSMDWRNGGKMMDLI